MTLDEIMELDGIEYGELGSVGSFLSAARAMNDNGVDEKDKLITRLLTHTAAIEGHLTKGLDAMLGAIGCTQQFKRGLGEFMSPVVGLVAELEREVIQFTRENYKPLSAAAMRSEVEFYAEEFSRSAETPAQMKLAAKFREFAEGLVGKRNEQGRDPKGKDLER